MLKVRDKMRAVQSKLGVVSMKIEATGDVALPRRCAASLRLVEYHSQNLAVYDRVGDFERKKNSLPASQRLAAHRQGKAIGLVASISSPTSSQQLIAISSYGSSEQNL